MNESLLTRINWLYYSLKEQYKFINSLFNRLFQDPLIKELLSKELYFYKTSLVLFKKSFSLYQEGYNKKIINDKLINDCKEMYLRRCLYNLNQSLVLFKRVNNSLMISSMVFHEIIAKIVVLIDSIKDLGRNLDKLLE